MSFRMRGQIPNMGIGAPRGTLYKRAGEDFQESFESWRSGEIITGGQVSTNGLWTCAYTGVVSGGSGVYIINASGRAQAVVESPTVSLDVSGNDTHASLLLTNKWFTDFDMTIDVNTVNQLRQNYPAKNWEVAWIMWRHSDSFHHYYFTQKISGIEFGKKDNNLNLDQQIFLKTASTPNLTLDTWSTYRIRCVGNHSSIWKDGTLLVSHADNGVSGATNAMYGGYIGCYNEDASVRFDSVSINSI